MSAYRQFGLPAASAGVASILAYLLMIFTLHVTIPSVLHAEPFNDTVATTHPTILANSSFTEGTGPSFDFLQVYNQFPTLGLSDNMVYDIIPTIPNAVGSTLVNASVYNVTCGRFPSPITLDSWYNPHWKYDNISFSATYHQFQSLTLKGNLQMKIHGSRWISQFCKHSPKKTSMGSDILELFNL
ncbi:hypothetical protein PHLGIDRAFT_15856 [Phlebiopsis gigantea 11061_1 CR5-6]|uniref:Uncharacterized protein n=1 Tax=Phlebiopsis gigantea (strain 11061_1 CR5-6) TaxID=745531 RepID=A0A0C3PDP8_PHLG1|nr:hypothetical protein PHLGIDRAFT_15856 [Phlebiopsis gigantea 11061_1 CR5-6]